MKHPPTLAALAAPRGLVSRSGRPFPTDMRRVLVCVVILTVTGALLPGCVMGPNYLRPKVDVPTSYRIDLKAAADAANTAWWKQFGDPILDALIDEALAHNLNLQIAVANVEQAAGIFTQTRSQLFPQVGYQGL